MNRKAVQNDDADQQSDGSTSRDSESLRVKGRGAMTAACFHCTVILTAVGNDGCVLIKGCPVPEHRGFEVTLFANPYGSSDNDNDYPIRMVLSSFYIPQLLNQVSVYCMCGRVSCGNAVSVTSGSENLLLSPPCSLVAQGYGVPDGLSACSLCQGPGCDQCTGSMNYSKAFDPAAPSYVGPVYTRVHRDAAIVGKCICDRCADHCAACHRAQFPIGSCHAHMDASSAVEFLIPVAATINVKEELVAFLPVWRTGAALVDERYRLLPVPFWCIPQPEGKEACLAIF